MEKMSIQEVISATGGQCMTPCMQTDIYSVCIDSKKCVKGSLFVALKGEKTDGHNFVEDAFAMGASACMVQPEYAGKESVQRNLIKVDSTLDALQNLAAYYRGKFNIPVIGVTGSVGKTTTKEMIFCALSETLNVLKTEGNYNGQLGLPLSVFNLEKSHEAAIFEMGVSKPGEMDRLEKIAQPTMGVITNVGLSHIENFEYAENTRNEKLKMIRGEEKTLYINGDSPLLSDVSSQTNAHTVCFGMNGNYPYKCEDICSGKDTTNFVLITSSAKDNISIPCLGIHNVYNALAAIAVASDMGIHIQDIKKGLSKFKNIGMRQQISYINGVTVIDDSYNASPDSVKSSVSILRNIKGEGKNIVVIADMLELGERSAEIHFETGRYIAIENIDTLITIGDNAKFMSDGAKTANQNIITLHCKNNSQAFEYIKENICKNDKILIKGSRGMHTEQIVKDLTGYLA